MNFISDDVRMYKQALESGVELSDLYDAYNALWYTSNLWNKMVLVYVDSRAESRAKKRKQKARAVKGLQEARVQMAKALMGEAQPEQRSEGVTVQQTVVPPGATYLLDDGTLLHNTTSRPQVFRVFSNGCVVLEDAI